MLHKLDYLFLCFIENPKTKLFYRNTRIIRITQIETSKLVN